MIAKQNEENLGHDENFYFDCGSGYTGIDICQDSSNYTVEMALFMFVCFASINLGLNKTKVVLAAVWRRHCHVGTGGAGESLSLQGK